MIEKFRTIRYAHFHLSWIHNRYKDLVRQGMYEMVSRVYMLHLVVCTVLVDKYHVYIDVQYMWMF